MSFENWEDVIVQWVNCLNITKPIEDIENCKCGDFFSKFLHELIDNTTISDDDTNVLQVILNLLESVYVDFKFTNYTYVQELKRDETIELCLLLMHYACMIEQNNTLIIPLCERLPHKTQLCIRKFLEMMTIKVTNTSLRSIANNCMNIADVSQTWTMIGDSPLRAQSPLQAFLRTPGGKSQLLEKKKEIKKLQAELELERYDKADLQEEIKEYKEKIKKLEIKLKEKCKRTSQLRMDLYKNEDTNLKDDKDMTEVKKIEKYLRSEIDNLEQYSHQLEMEQIKLQEKNEDLQKRLETSNEELRKCQERVFGLETEHTSIQEKYRMQGIQLEDLKAQCSELTNIIDSLRPNPCTFESSFECSMLKWKNPSFDTSIHNLAESVIEVQLRECHTENTELKQLLQESAQKSKILDDQLTVVTKQYQAANHNCMEMQNNNDQLVSKIEELTESHKAIHDQLEKSRVDLLNLSRDLSDKDSMVSYLNQSLTQTNHLNEQFQFANEDLKHELCKTKTDFKANQMLLLEKDNICESLRIEARSLQQKYEQSVTNFNHLSTEFSALQKCYTNTMEKFTCSLDKLAKLSEHCRNEILEDKFEMFDMLLQTIQIKKMQDKDAIEKLTMSLNDSEDLVKNLDATNMILNDKLSLNAEERNKFKQMLEASELHVNELEKNLELKKEEIDNVSLKISELHKTMNELQSLKPKEANHIKEDVVRSNFGKIIDNIINDIKKTKQDYNQNISMKNKEIDMLNKQLTEAVQTNETLSCESVEKEKSYLEKIFILETEIKEYSYTALHLEATIEMAERNLKIKQAEIDELLTGRTTMQDNFEKVKHDLEKKINLTKDTQKKLEIELQIITSEKTSLENNLQKLKTDLKEFEIEKGKLIEQNNSLKLQYSECFESLSKRDREGEERDNIISESSKQLLNLKLELELYKQKHKELQVEMDKVRQEENKYVFCLGTLESKNKEFESKIQQLTYEKDVLKDVRDNLEKKCNDLEHNLETIITQLREKNEELNDYCNQLAMCKQENEVEMQSVNAALQEAQNKLEELTTERNDEVQRSDKEISTLKSNLHETNNRIYELTSREISYIQEIEIIKAELNSSFQKYAENFNAYQELKLEHEAHVKHLTETLHEVVSKCNVLEDDNKKYNDRLSIIIREQELLCSEKITLEVKLVNQQKKYTQELENTREQFLLDINNLKNKEKKLEQSLTKALKDLEDGKGIHYRLENEVKKLTLKLHDIEEEKNYLQERFQLLEDTKKEVDSEYSQLKLTHKNYISESEHNLKIHEKKLEADIESLQHENQTLINNYFELQKATEDLHRDNGIAIENHEKTIYTLNDELKNMTEKMANLESLNSTISKEQESLLRNTRKMKLEIDQRTDEVEKQNAIMSKLQCAYDILQTGKDRVELDLQTVIEMKEKLEQEKNRNNTLLEGTIKTYEEELKKLNDQLEEKNKMIAEKDKMLSDKMRELSELRQVYETLSSEKKSLQKQCQQSQQLHNEFLSQIDEENLKTIGDMTFDFMEMKMAYQEFHYNLKKLKKEKRKLEKAVEESNVLKQELQTRYDETQKELEEIRSKASIYEDIVVEERTKMHSIICELYYAISDLDCIRSEKLKTEKQQKSMSVSLEHLKKDHDELFKIKNDFNRKREEEIDKIHINAQSLKNESLMTLNNIRSDFISSKSLSSQLEETIQKERDAKTFLEMKLLTLMNEKTKYEQICRILCISINKISDILLQKPIAWTRDFENLSEKEMSTLTEEIEKNIAEVYGKIYEISETIVKLERERVSIDSKLSFLENERLTALAERKKLLNEYETLNNERDVQKQNVEHEKQLLEEEIVNLKTSLADAGKWGKEIENLKNENDVLHQTLQSLKQNNVRAYNDYQKFLDASKNYKSQIDRLLKERNSTESTVNNLKQQLLALQMKFIHIPQEFLYKQYFDQKESLQVIVDDIQKQFNRYSRMSFNVVCNFGTLLEKLMQAIFSEKTVEIEVIFKDLEIEETQVKIEELKDRALDSLEQIGTLEKALENLETKSTKVLKENKKSNQVADKDNGTEEEYRKKYLSIKQKLTLTENVKNNYEKKLKQLREENKKLSANSKPLDEDVHYRTLLQQHIEAKDGYERQIEELKSKQQELERELVTIKKEKIKMEESHQKNIRENYEKQLVNMREKQSNLEKEIVELNTQKTTVCELLKAENALELSTLRDAYGRLMGDKSKLDSDYNSLRKMYDDRTAQLQEYALIKQAYEKLLEESNQMMTEIDTLKFKRNKDKEEYIRLLKNEREEFAKKENSSITQIHTEYESKLETMKKKMITLYKEEVDKEMRKVLVEKADNTVLLHTLERYKTDLEDAKRTIENLQKLNTTVQKNQLMLSRESLGSRSVRSECDVRELRTREVLDCPRSGKRSSVHPARTVIETRKCATLPKNMDVIEEDSTRQRMNSNIAAKIEMEDEGECFNNKYLTDLTEGRCVVPTGRASTTSRMTELAWRNSKVLPHLKSSYPAELQMVTPSKFKEEDIKASIVDLDDSMSSKLLPLDKALRKKEQGTTSYKRPGPPTPSKNGGRMSLQGSEIKDGLRDSKDSKTPKRTTPNKIKAFFLGKSSVGQSGSSSSASNIEVGLLNESWQFCSRCISDNSETGFKVSLCSCHEKYVLPLVQWTNTDEHQSLKRFVAQHLRGYSAHFIFLIIMFFATIYINKYFDS